ncbi:helicase associated domain-containing protein [Streptomyces sp. NPDC059649]|uniref:helicase associated domain-containing protein n=1 Tax=Streptomyces sp. NPDC059649 TaxID=3346895 RepID=UPI0036C35C18
MEHEDGPPVAVRPAPDHRAAETVIKTVPAAKPATNWSTEAQQAFQRGLAALTRWMEREGAHRPVPRGRAEENTVDGETDPVAVKLGVWVSNTKSRRDKLAREQLGALRELGMEWV